MYKNDLALNNPQGLICYEPKSYFSLSSLLFAIVIRTQNYILWKCKGSCKVGRNDKPWMIQRLLPTMKKELEFIIQTITIFRKVIGTEFIIQKFEILKMKRSEKRNNWMNRIAQSGKHLNTWRKRKQQMPWKIRRRYHQTNGDEKHKKEIPQKN